MEKLNGGTLDDYIKKAKKKRKNAEKSCSPVQNE